ARDGAPMCARTTFDTGAQLGRGLLRTTIRAVRTSLVSTCADGRPSTRTCTLPACAGRRIATTLRGEPTVRAPLRRTSSRGLTTIAVRTAAGPATAVRNGCVTVTVSLPC